jgi:LysM repeat protein
MKHFKLVLTLFVFTIAISCGQQKKYITYKVKQGETIQTIADKLDVSASDLLRLNPDVSRTPRPDTEIFIPSRNAINLTQKKEKITDIFIKDVIEKDTRSEVDVIEDLIKDYVFHRVSPGDTFYSLTRYYNVLKSDLLLLNPELNGGLKLGSIIKIKKLVEGENLDIIYKDFIEVNTPLKVALLLPFRAATYDTIPTNKIFVDGDRNLTNIVTDFYLGAELAIDSLRNQGLKIELSVFDTENRNTKINEIIDNKSLKEIDVTIGSIYYDETIKLANSINSPFIFPIFSKAQTAFTSPKVVKTSPDKHLYKEKLLSYVSKNYSNENIIILGDSTVASITEIRQIATILKQHNSINVVHEIIPHYGYIAQERFLKMMKADTTNVVNWVIIATQNDVIAANAVNSLISFPDPPEPKKGEEPLKRKEKTNYLVKLFGFEKSEYVDYNKLAQLQFMYVTDTYVDESSLAARVFNNQYLKKNNAFPSFYATRGFDVTYDVIMRLASGKKLSDTFKDGVSYRVESKFDYNKKAFGVSENRGLFLLEFQSNLSLKRIE